MVKISDRINWNYFKKGHALAFGSVIAMSCDYRIMADNEKFKTGLQAVHLVNLLNYI